MNIEIRLQKLLQDYNLDYHGAATDIAEEVPCHRHTISRLYHNELSNPPLDVLGRVCDWLIRKGVPANVLPGALFGAGSPGLWVAIAAPRTVTIYLGEYQQMRQGSQISWISRRDSSVETEIVRWLSMAGNCGPEQPTLVTEYVPFRADLGEVRLKVREFESDRAKAQSTFRKMRDSLSRTSAVLIGSQRVNYLVECMVADLFGVAPFAAGRQRRVPFHLAFPKRVRQVRSCFGGVGNPPQRGGPVKEGTYYLDAQDQWQICPYEENARDAGIVLTCYEPGTKGLQLAVMGLTGRATELLGRHVIHKSEPFWPPYAETRGRKIGAYICPLTFGPAKARAAEESTTVHFKEPIRISAEVLLRYIK